MAAKMTMRIACVLAVAAALGGAQPIGAQQPPPVIVPVEREPQHRPVFQNDILAVLDVRFPPGYVSLFHTHSNDNVSVRIETGPTRIDTLTTTGDVQTAVLGRVVFNSATPPYTHRVANVGQTLVRILDIEILAKGPTQSAAALDDLAGHDVVVDNPRVRISRVVLAPGANLASHSHPQAWLEAVVRGPVPGSFEWRAPGTTVPRVEALPTGREFVEILVK
jgi:hypothetical protein